MWRIEQIKKCLKSIASQNQCKKFQLLSRDSKDVFINNHTIHNKTKLSTDLMPVKTQKELMKYIDSRKLFKAPRRPDTAFANQLVFLPKTLEAISYSPIFIIETLI